MTEYRYIFGQSRTGFITDEISLYGVSLNSLLNEGSDLTGTFQFDQTGKTNQLLVNATTPGRTFVVVERDGVVIWDGNLVSRTYQSQSKSCQFWARSLAGYPARVKLDETYYPEGFVKTEVEQTEAFLELWETLQSDPESNLRVELPASLDTGILRTVSILPHDNKFFGDVLAELSDGLLGFDWRIVTVKENHKYRRIMQIGYPSVGISNPRQLVFEYPGTITNYWRTETLNDGATRITGLGAGEGEDMVKSTVVHQDRLDAGYLRWDMDVDFKEIHDQEILDDLTAQAAKERKIPARRYSLDLRPDLVPQLPRYLPGDACTLSINDAAHPGGYRKETKIVGWRLTPQSGESTDLLQLYLDGGELA